MELLQWNDGTVTINMTMSGLSQTSYGPYAGPLPFPEALIAVGTTMRMEKP